MTFTLGQVGVPCGGGCWRRASCSVPHFAGPMHRLIMHSQGSAQAPACAHQRTAIHPTPPRTLPCVFLPLQLKHRDLSGREVASQYYADSDGEEEEEEEEGEEDEEYEEHGDESQPNEDY